jgi:hypothetical protein
MIKQIVIIGLALFILSCQVPKDILDACYVVDEYKNNEMLAISKYDDKTIIIRGKAGVKGDSIAGIYLQINCNPGWPAIQCFFNKSHAKQLSTVNKNDIVTILGKCKGRTLGTLMVENCSFYSGK